MFDRAAVKQVLNSVEQWHEADVQKAQMRLPERHDPFTTISSAAVNRLYTPADVATLDYERDLGMRGRLPIYARHPSHRLSRQTVDDAYVRQPTKRLT